MNGGGQVALELERLDLNGGAYYVDVGLYERGWAYAGASTGLDEAGHLDIPAMVAALGRLAATGAAAAELATHPGAHDDPDRVRYRWAYQWDDEYVALRSATVRAAVDELGFRLGTFAELPAPGPPAEADR